MRFTRHSELEGLHAFLSPSKYHWVNYDEEKLLRSWVTARAAALGTEMHELAARLIRLKVKLPKTRQTINAYVNDAIGYGMTPEVILKYSNNAFGSVDAISFKNRVLRIHDLKTGDSRVSMTQLKIYAALFCLEYGIRPSEIRIELRIYQSDEIMAEIAELDDIVRIMDRIVTFDKLIEQRKMEEMV